MKKFIEEIESWFNSETNISIIDMDSLDNFSIKNEILLYGEKTTKERLKNLCIVSYFKRIEQCMKTYIPTFSFSNYRNLNDFKMVLNESESESYVYFLEWVREENINEIKELMQVLNNKEYKLEDLWNIIDYYDYLVTSSLKYNDEDTVLDFLMVYISRITEVICKISDK